MNKIQDWLKKNWKIVLVAVIVLAVIIFLIVYFAKSSIPPAQKGNGIVKLNPPEMFYGTESIKTGGNIGRDVWGNYLNGSSTPVEKGLTTKEDLEKYLLTYAAGHPFYEKKDWGYLRGSSWNDHVDSCGADKLTNYIDVSSMKDKVVTIEAGVPTKDKPSEYGPFYLDENIDCEGIVVRQGGILLLKGPLIIKTKFIIVESGGLLQAGSSYDDDHRYDGAQIQIRLQTHDYGYGKSGVPCSQYSYEIYAPGVKNYDDNNKPLPPEKTYTAYQGTTMAFGNTFGVKSIGVGFNGNLQLCGRVSKNVSYKGNWGAKTSLNSSTNDYIGEKELLSSESKYLASSYPNTWCHLKTTCKVGDKKIVLDDSVSGCLQGWEKGSQIVITCKTKQYDNMPTNKGISPIWLNSSNKVQADANELANKTLIGETGVETGVEVCTIDHVDGTTVYLKDNLKFTHVSDYTNVHNSNRKDYKDIYVDTRVHVGLLTRSILIISDFNTSSPGSGCNKWVDSPSTSFANKTVSGKSNQHPLILASGRLGGLSPDKKDMMLMKMGAFKDNINENFDGYEGPGGSMACNWRNGTNQLEPSAPCYTARENSPDKNKLCMVDGKLTHPTEGKTDKGEPIPGHWIFDTDGKTGCNAIHGGQSFFRYGSSVRIDGVEMKYMGTAANFGTIAQYSLHWHLSGWIKSFNGYLRDKKYPRDGNVENNAIWCSFTRWCTMHGVHEAVVRNNIGFISYGSGFFVEDGTESFNTIEHNIGISTLPCRNDPYTNPVPIYPNIAADICYPSTYWLKNNINILSRNVGCCSPRPVMGIWNVPQLIADLRGPSAVCQGDPIRLLPGLAGKGVVNQYKYNGHDCWLPADFALKGYARTDNCVTFLQDNVINDYFLCVENVFYNISGVWTEQPDIHFSPCDPDPGPAGTNGCASAPCTQTMEKQPQILPITGMNSCIDENLVGSYPTPMWHEENTFQPLTADQLKTFDNDPGNRCCANNECPGNVKGLNNVCSKSIPKIFSGWLSFNLADQMGQTEGAGWAHLGSLWLINCAFLMNGGPSGSTRFEGTVGDAVLVYPKIYHIYHNLICDGTIILQPNSLLWSGEKTFLSDTVIPQPAEYQDQRNVAFNHYYFDFGSNALFDVIPRDFFTHECTTKRTTSMLWLFDMSAGQKHLYTIQRTENDCTIKDEGPQDKSFFGCKFPYVCQQSGDNTCVIFKDSNGNPQGDIVINAYTGIFTNKYGEDLLKYFCQMFSYMDTKQPPNTPFFSNFAGF